MVIVELLVYLVNISIYELCGDSLVSEVLLVDQLR